MESLNPDGLRISWSTQNSYFADYSGKQISAAEVVPRQEAPVGGEIDLPGLHAVLIVNFKPYTPKGGKLQLVQINGNDGKPFLLRFSDIPVR